MLKENVFITSPMASENVVQYKIISSLEEEISIELFLADIRPYIREQIRQKLEEFNSIKFNLRLFGEYVKGMDAEMVLTLKHFSTNFSVVREVGEVDEKIAGLFVELTKAAEEYQERDSGWAITAFKFCELTICRLKSIPVGSHLALPKRIYTKKATINVKNNDVYCFKWCILATIAFKKDNLPGTQLRRLSRPEYYKIGSIRQKIISFRNREIDLSGLTFPVTNADISHFESKNSGISINIYELYDDKRKGEWKVMGPARAAKSTKDFHINLLTIYKPNRSQYHYCLITNMQRLVKTQFTRSNATGQCCDLCQTFYTTGGNRHKEECTRVRSVFPAVGTKTKFTHFEKQISPPIIIYADIEALLKPTRVIQKGEGTRIIQEHEACAVSYYIRHVYNEDCDEQYVFDGKYIL
uniref:Uncharacterized protein n=1 Tax=Glossina brevipalpis TaxID=37001 RepID=A0A1A9WHF9_9MUSC